MSSRFGSLAGSLALHAALFVVLSAIRFAAPALLPRHQSILLSPPPAKVQHGTIRARLQPPRALLAPAATSIRVPMPVSAPPRAPVIPSAAPPVPAIVAVEAPPPIPSPVPPVIEHPAPLPTGKFADAAAKQPDDHAAPQVRVGSFDGAAASSSGKPGPGRAAVSQSAFAAADPEQRHERSRPLRASGFTDLAMAGPAGIHRTTAASRLETALEIISKPRPLYSDSARRLGVEGDVLLEAEFEASGRVRVLRVIRGLGHGLDENATLAADGIRFRPATINGSPVDTVATVRITFQLAN
jgi:TonB family protein